MKIPIGLDPGHGGPDKNSGRHTGAKNPSIAWTENQWNLFFCQKLYKAILGVGWDFEPFLLRTTADEFVSFTERAQRAKEFGCKLVFNVHVNSNVNPKAHGGEAYYWPNNPIGAQVADMFIRSLPPPLHKMTKAIEAFNDPTTAEDNWIEGPRTVMRKIACTTVLTENGYISNEEDARALGSGVIQEGLIVAHLAALVEFARASGY